jgi:hypothetical protein
MAEGAKRAIGDFGKGYFAAPPATDGRTTGEGLALYFRALIYKTR